jgi:hypothetical protein
MSACVTFEKGPHAIRNVVNFRRRKVRSHRKTQELTRESFRDWELASSPSIPRKRRLQVYGNRITDHSIHASRLQMAEKFVALYGPDSE